jgi:hypothetical protein
MPDTICRSQWVFCSCTWTDAKQQLLNGCSVENYLSVCVYSRPDFPTVLYLMTLPISRISSVQFKQSPFRHNSQQQRGVRKILWMVQGGSCFEIKQPSYAKNKNII